MAIFMQSLFLWLMTAVLDVALPMKLWKHYFNVLLPALSLAAALGCELLSQQFAARRDQVLAAAVLITVAPSILLMVKYCADSRDINRTNVPQAIAAQIKREGSDGREVYVFDYDPLVYAHVATVLPTKYMLGIELADFSDSSDANGPREVARVLAGHPRWIVVAEPSPYHFPAAVWQELQSALRHYRLDSIRQEHVYVDHQPLEVTLYRSD